MSKAVAAVSAVDRLGFTLFLAVAIHATAILGVGFSMTPKPPPAQTLEITLAQFESKKTPEKADFIAQIDQQGSGKLDEKALPTTRDLAEIQHHDIQQTAALQPLTQPTKVAPLPTPAEAIATEVSAKDPHKSVNKAPKQQLLTTQAKQPKQRPSQPKKQPKATPPPPATGSAQSLLSRSLEIASLEAKLDFQHQLDSKKPRTKRLTSASTKSHSDAVYLANWRRKIESIGNLNYPKEAQQNQLYGSLRMMVSILPDGSVKEIRILHSSGNRVLDDAAVRIVQLAAPFQEFPIEMRKNTDILEIIRTWKFEKSTRTY